MTAASPPGEPSNAASAPCPGCGRVPFPGSAFCASCGRPLATPVGGVSGPRSPSLPPDRVAVPPDVTASQGPSASNPSVARPPGAPEGRPVPPSRPLSAEERDQLLRLVRSPGAAAAGTVGLLAGLTALTLSATELLGVPYDPAGFFIVVLATSMIALVAGGAALGRVRPPRGAFRYGRAVELNGTPTSDSLRVRGHSAHQMGPVRLMVPKRSVSPIRIGEPQALVVALGAPPLRTLGLGLVPRGVLLRVNGSPLPKPPIVLISW
jgi:hypothetical protein